VCTHPKLNDLEACLKAGTSVSELARRFHLTRYGIMRHRAGHADAVTVREIRQPKPLHPRLAGLNDALKIDRHYPTPPQVEADAKEQFLTEYAAHGDFLGAGQVAGVTRATIQVWLEHDEDFTLRFHQAKAAVVDQLEATALDRAMHGAKLIREVWRGDRLIERIIEWRPQEMTILKLLQALKPEVYAEKLQVTQTQIVKTVDADAWAAV
jgi:hypothetical protein